MKKIIICFTAIFLSLISICFISSQISVDASASYTIKETIKKDLGYGVTLEEVICDTICDNSELNNYEGRAQHIYTASISKDSPAKIVQYSYVYNGENKFNSGSIRQIASKYQKDHPDKMVICATNNWLAWVDKATYGEYRGVQSSLGLNYRMSDIEGTESYHLFQSMGSTDTVLGFDADGNMIFNDNYQKSVNATDTMMISYYSQKTEVKVSQGIKVNKVNTAPGDGELAIIMSNYGGTETKFDGAKIYKMKGLIIRHDDHKTSGEDQKERDAFALGDYVQMVDEIAFSKDDPLCYYFVSKNADFDALDFENNSILSQYEFTGYMSGIVGATPYFTRIVNDGNIVTGDIYTHPRTVFIQKEDGTYALSVIDGRQVKAGRLGMCYEEMAYFYKNYYNAYQCFNYDGGGSSAMVIQGKNGTFEIINSPSDGDARGIANITMIVVDRPDINVTSNEKDTSIDLTVKTGDASIKKIVATLNGKTYDIVDGKLLIEGLTPDTDYQISFDYYKEGVEELQEGIKYNVSTTKERATLLNVTCNPVDQNTLSFIFEVKDDGKTFFSGHVYINEVMKSFTKKGETITFDGLTPNTEYDVKIEVNSSSSNANILITETYNKKFTTHQAEWPEEVSINAESFQVELGSTLQTNYDFTPEDTVTLLTYKSSDETVATIDEYGLITPVSVGQTTISVTTKEGKTDSFILTVVEPQPKSGCNSGFVVNLILISNLLGIIYIITRKH